MFDQTMEILIVLVGFLCVGHFKREMLSIGTPWVDAGDSGDAGFMDDGLPGPDFF